ncbi:IS110 family transposase [Mycobacterium marinum]|uniref:IS110 family transposase n=1 Tax=Mycobacterium marinum TaxID=1781 RepID=UPI00235915EB|nr:IS110 family transposase [Mycobacterium marinum]WCS17800.1 IS110 family transposase [Mycobacterium marinum]
MRLPGDGPDHRQTIKQTFKTFYGMLKHAARWLTEQQVTHVAMEATGIYSMPVYHALIEHGEFEKVLVCNAGHVKNVPGRKTDLSDAEWLVHLLECGLLRGSFIPPAQIKAARDVIRYRTKLTESRTSELQRLGNVLQDAGIKVDSVASTITTQSVRVMVEALIDGERRPLVLADLAKGKMRAKIPDLQRALEGRFDDHHALMCRLHLDHLDHLEKMIARLEAQVEDMMAPFCAQRDLLITIPGIGPLTAAAIISEAGTDIAETFPSAEHFASWIGVCPGNHESAGKRHSGKPRKGNQHLQHVLVECGWAASRTPGYLQSLYRRHVRKFGGSRNTTAKNKAAVAVAHKLSVIIWHVLATGQPYTDLGADYLARRTNPETETRRLIAKLQALGHNVIIEPAA